MAKLLSISIAAYNVENFLKGTLDSLLADEETLAKMEVIVVNDGSKDRTAEITQNHPESQSGFSSGSRCKSQRSVIPVLTPDHHW